ncbi:hypothetical protein ACM01_45390 [Streptomyces viridochromogenes]|uniref:Uncharacterized protein n=1 Tax=Streptomyces viridochromogenes TaxID=1938 RepID=A0A0J7YU54_STRVR|nr:hypothetical protein ACM01_45390 [Streptomyces viridochromogenes]KOG16608.1 hypothetical protein ADK36_26695 [Streptomyces viridochromogenes]KOG17314.1 hypothetical protein ADK35_24175 [Streptomyces viridochromogenes]
MTVVRDRAAHSGHRERRWRLMHIPERTRGLRPSTQVALVRHGEQQGIAVSRAASSASRSTW